MNAMMIQAQKDMAAYYRKWPDCNRVDPGNHNGRPVSKESELRKSVVAEKYSAGMKLYEIARELGEPPHRIQSDIKWLRRHGKV